MITVVKGKIIKLIKPKRKRAGKMRRLEIDHRIYVLTTNILDIINGEPNCKPGNYISACPSCESRFLKN
jgi:hypothetical protein